MTECQALEPALLLVLTYWNQGVCSTHNRMSINFLPFDGSISPASTCCVAGIATNAPLWLRHSWCLPETPDFLFPFANH